MGLRQFHLFFICVSVILAAFVAAWSGAQYRAGGDLSFVATSLVGVASAAGLAVYAARFQRKTRNL